MSVWTLRETCLKNYIVTIVLVSAHCSKQTPDVNISKVGYVPQFFFLFRCVSHTVFLYWLVIIVGILYENHRIAWTVNECMNISITVKIKLLKKEQGIHHHSHQSLIITFSTVALDCSCITQYIWYFALAGS